MSGCQCIHDASPDTSTSPANKAIVASRVRTEVVGQIAPRCSRSQDPEDTIENAPVVYAGYAARLVRKHRPDGRPLMVGEFVAHDSELRFGVLNHGWTVLLNNVSEVGRTSAFGIKLELLRRA